MTQDQQNILDQRNDWEQVVASNTAALMDICRTGGVNILVEADVFYRHRIGGNYKYTGRRSTTADKCLRIIVYTGLKRQKHDEVRFVMVVFERASAQFGQAKMAHHYTNDAGERRNINAITNPTFEKLWLIATKDINDMSKKMRQERAALLLDIMANGRLAVIESNLQKYKPFLSDRDNPDKLERYATDVAASIKREKAEYVLSLPYRFMRDVLIAGKKRYANEWGLFPAEKRLLEYQESIAILSDLKEQTLGYLVTLERQKHTMFQSVFDTRKELLSRDYEAMTKSLEFLNNRLDRAKKAAINEEIKYHQDVLDAAW